MQLAMQMGAKGYPLHSHCQQRICIMHKPDTSQHRRLLRSDLVVYMRQPHLDLTLADHHLHRTLNVMHHTIDVHPHMVGMVHSHLFQIPVVTMLPVTTTDLIATRAIDLRLVVERHDGALDRHRDITQEAHRGHTIATVAIMDTVGKRAFLIFIFLHLLCTCKFYFCTKRVYLSVAIF